LINYFSKKNINTPKKNNNQFKMRNNLYTFSISKYVAENNFNYFNDDIYSEEDRYTNEQDDTFNYLQPEESEKNEDIFLGINKIMNPEPNDDLDEKKEEDKIYFLDIKEKEDSSFLRHKRNNNDSILEENQPIKQKAQIISEQVKKDQKETKPSTGESANNKIKKILFIENQKLYRNDYFIKKFKVSCFSDYAKDELNEYLKACEFPKELNINKIYMPNNKAFTSIANLKKNKEFLLLEIYKIFSMENGNGQNQIKNGLNFTTIFNSKHLAKNIEAYKNLVKFLNLTAEEVINKFYVSKEFENFKSKSEIKAYDDAFYQEKKFRLLDNGGFIRLINGDY
jgi:hypothetical protein